MPTTVSDSSVSCPTPGLRCPTLSAKDSASYLGVAEQTLSVWRCTGRYALPFIRVGRAIRYRISDLDKFLAERTVGGGQA